jgi:hypothetical protein
LAGEELVKTWMYPKCFKSRKRLKIIIMEGIMIFTTMISLMLFIFGIYWMIRMLSLAKQSRIIHSMTLKTILKYCASKGVDIDIQQIQKEVEESVG